MACHNKGSSLMQVVCPTRVGRASATITLGPVDGCFHITTKGLIVVKAGEEGARGLHPVLMNLA